MRVTNRMMTTNALTNISRNKRNTDLLGYQYSTQQKIRKPSDDPVIAVRSLKFSVQIDEIVQYLDKNIPDAESWMDVTEGAMDSMNKVLEEMHTYFDQAANGTNNDKDRKSIVEALRKYNEQFYQGANADYGGRYLFTGYRTDTPLLFDKTSLTKHENNKTMYTIKEELNFGNITAKSYVNGGAVYNAATDADGYAQQAPDIKKANRLQLSYTNLDKGPNRTDGGITRPTGLSSLTFKNPADGTEIKIPGNGSGYTFTEVSLSALPQGACYEPGSKDIIIIPETGELIFGKEAYAMAQINSNIQAEYTKSEFKENDIIPQHYFESAKSSLQTNAAGNLVEDKINYNNPSSQNINYEINFSQKLTVNTLAKDAFTTSIGMKMEEIIRAVNDVFDLEDQINKITNMINIESDSTKVKNLEELKKQLELEKTFKQTVLTESFGSGLTTAKNSQQKLSDALANHGSRDLRLQMTKERLEDDKTTFTELKDINDMVDLEDSVINYKQAQVIYDASLSCASTVVSKTLLDYI